MKERPILFSGEMVRAILEGRKTQTRRVMKPKPIFVTHDGSQGVPYWLWLKGKEHRAWREGGDQSLILPASPYGQIGDRLWVRETFSYTGFDNTVTNQCMYREDGEQDDRHPVWRPSIFMPRWASRITLEIVNIRVQRVHDICFHNNPLNVDFVAEGIKPIAWLGNQRVDDYKTPFIKLWDLLNAKRGYPWLFNPWVWVIEFKRIGE